MEARAPNSRGGKAATGKRSKFGFRVTDALRAKLEAEATALHRSVSEVIESRLEASFATDEMRVVIRGELREIVREEVRLAVDGELPKPEIPPQPSLEVRPIRPIFDEQGNETSHRTLVPGDVIQEDDLILVYLDLPEDGGTYFFKDGELIR